MRQIQVVSFYFMLAALIMLLAGALLPHHHHTIYICGYDSSVTVVHLGSVHCADKHDCSHACCTHHDHSDSACPDNGNFLFEPYVATARVVVQCDVQYDKIVVQPFEMPLFECDTERLPHQYLNLKIPDIIPLNFGLRAPPTLYL